MGITSPKLDDRSFTELRNELIRRIPVHAPEWTDHNASDPGIALLELFAWLAENLLYRMNRVPEKAKTEFLRLLNLPLRPAGVARTLVQFTLPALGRSTAPVPVLFGAGERPVTVLAPGDIAFQIRDEVTVLPVDTLPVIKQVIPADETQKIQGLEDIKQLAKDQLQQSSASKGSTDGQPNLEPVPYLTVPLPAPEDGIQPPVTALSQTVDRTLWLALLAPQATVKGLKKPEERQKKLAELRHELAGHVISLGVWVDDELCGPPEHMGCPAPNGDDVRYPLVWEIATGRFRNGVKRFDQIIYERLSVEKDDTDGLVRSGILRLRLPVEGQSVETGFGTWTGDDGESGLGDPDLLGFGDLPPRLDDPLLEDQVLTWLRCYRPVVRDALHYPDPRIRHVDANMVEVEQAITAPRELLGEGEGLAGQVVRLAHTPALTNSVQLQVREPQGWVNWRQVDDLTVAAPNDPFYELDALTGEVRFGDGIHGRMPRPGEVIRCLGYRYGGGAKGNVAAGAINRVKSAQALTGRLKVTNPFAAMYGRDAETEAEALQRIPQALRHRNRAVASEDFRDLALATPGIHLGRVEVLPRHKPHERADGVPGVVTLIVLPAYDRLHPNEPTPDRSMLRRVCEHMEAHRLVTTELYVTPPEYVPVWTSVAIEVEPRDYGPETVRRWVELAVRQYLAPLPPYGPDGKGWPFGRDVRAPDIAAAVLRVKGVRLVNDVKVLGPQTDSQGEDEDLSGVALDKWQLPVTRGVVVVTDDVEAPHIDRVTGDSALAADERPPLQYEGVEGAEGAAEPVPIPAPVELEEC